MNLYGQRSPDAAIVTKVSVLLSGVHPSNLPKNKENTVMTTTTVKDPVCGMEVKASSTGPHSEYKGQTYNFCCSGCKGKFDHAPEQYMGEVAAAAKGDKSGCCCG